MEAAYYSVNKVIVFPEVCFHCDGRSGGKLCNNELIRKLKESFVKVRPICLTCINCGQKPATWGPKNNIKPQTKKKKDNRLISTLVYSRFIQTF